MTAAGVCAICGRAGLCYSCSLCGRIVCGNCVTVNGVCRDCMAGRKIGVTEHVDAEKIARKMLEEGLGK